MNNKFTSAKNHSVGIGAIVLSIAWVLATHSPENPVTIYSFAPALLALGQYLTSLAAHKAQPPNQITAPQVNLIHDLAQERGITKGQLCEWTNNIDLCDLTRAQGTTLIQKIKSLPRKRISRLVEPGKSNAKEIASNN